MSDLQDLRRELEQQRYKSSKIKERASYTPSYKSSKVTVDSTSSSPAMDSSPECSDFSDSEQPHPKRAEFRGVSDQGKSAMGRSVKGKSTLGKRKLKLSNSFHHIPVSKRYKEKYTRESNASDVDSTLLSLVEHLSRQEAVTDYLIKKIHSLEESGDQCLSLLSRLSKQMSGMAKQLRALSQRDNSSGLGDKNTEGSVSGDHSSKIRSTTAVGNDLDGDHCTNVNGSQVHPSSFLPLSAHGSRDDESGSNAHVKQYSTPVANTTQADVSKVNHTSLDCGSPPPLAAVSGDGNAEDRLVIVCSEDEMIFPSDFSEHGSCSLEIERRQDHPSSVEVKPELPENSQYELSTPFYRQSSLTESSGYETSLSKLSKPNESSAHVITLPSSGAALFNSQVTSVPPVAKPILLQYYSSNPLPSSAIDRSSLGGIDETLHRYKDTKPHFLAGKLACEAVFGKEVLRQCTPLGCSSYPALPQAELYQIKQLVLNASPSYWNRLEEFEELWRLDIIRRITYTCSRFRREFNKKGGVTEVGV